MKKIKILIPVYNDWKSVFELLKNINLQIKDCLHEVSVLIINDASSEDKNAYSFKNFLNIKSIKLINMKSNRGHARCNATGLKYIKENEDFDYVIPMDGDGEDRPEELSLLIEKLENYPGKVITADRIKRSEGIFFKFCYFSHKYLTFIFTGKSIKFGNYTCLPSFIVERMTKEKATWSSFSGSLTKVIDDKEKISVPSIRGQRYFGPSKMSFFNLLKHSFSIIAVFKSTLLIRSLIFLITYFFLIIQNISLITLIPVFLIFILLFATFIISKRENLNDLNNSLKNISNIEIIS